MDPYKQYEEQDWLRWFDSPSFYDTYLNIPHTNESSNESYTKYKLNNAGCDDMTISNQSFIIKNGAEIKSKIESKNVNMYTPKKVIFNAPATIVFWEDGTKTVVKSDENTEFNEYYGFCVACAKKLIGSNTKINKVVKNADRT